MGLRRNPRTGGGGGRHEAAAAEGDPIAAGQATALAASGPRLQLDMMFWRLCTNQGLCLASDWSWS